MDDKKIVLSPISSKEYFIERLSAGFSKKNMTVYPAVQAYIVDLLEYYLDARNLFEEEVDELGQRKPSTLAEMYLKASSSEAGEKVDLLKKLGDKSLYISGFFGDSLAKKLVDIEYYANLGGAAYATLATTVKVDTLSRVYSTIADQFLSFVDVLTFVSHDSMAVNDQGILRLYDRYLTTGSEIAREKLNELGVVTLPKDQGKLVRQN